MSEPAMTKTDLLLLGLLLDRPMHGYELYQQIQAEGIDGWFNISAAGVYYSLRKLRDRGYVTESRQRKGGSSRKSIFHVTGEGRDAFFPAMEAELANQEEMTLDYDLGIYLLNRLPLLRAIPQLEKRQAYLAGQIEQVLAAQAAEQDNGHSQLHLAILDHKRRFLEMEQDWLADVVCSLQAESGDCYEGSAQDKLMILNGDLRDFHLPDLFHLIVSGRHSGTLRVTDGAESRTLAFDDGQPVYASFLRQGEMSGSACDCEQVLDGLCELFRWRAGRFSFDQKIEVPDGSVPVQCSAEQLILRGCRKVDNWTTIQRLVPAADTIFEPGHASGQLERLALTPTEEQIIAAADGVRDVTAIARELDLTLFETSRAIYCLTAIGVLRTADLDKIRLRRVFREIAELMCGSTLAWRSSPDDRTCEHEVNRRCEELPLCLYKGRIKDEADPQLGVDELQEMYHLFLKEQFRVVSRFFGQTNAQQSFERTLRQLAPELQRVAERYDFDRIAKN